MSRSPRSEPEPRDHARCHLRGWLALALGLAALAGSCRKSESDGSLHGRQAPAIQLETLDHGRFYLAEQRGKPVVLVFWDTSCEPCKRQLRELEALRKSLGPSRLSVAGVCQDPENIDVARRLVQALGLGFPTLLDHDGRVGKTYRVDEVPTTFVVSPSGEIGLAREGYTEPLMRQLRSTVERYLEASSDGP